LDFGSGGGDGVSAAGDDFLLSGLGFFRGGGPGGRGGGAGTLRSPGGRGLGRFAGCGWAAPSPATDSPSPSPRFAFADRSCLVVSAVSTCCGARVVLGAAFFRRFVSPDGLRGGGAGAEGTVTGSRHTGQRTCVPARLSGTFSDWPHWQRTRTGIDKRRRRAAHQIEEKGPTLILSCAPRIVNALRGQQHATSS